MNQLLILFLTPLIASVVLLLLPRLPPKVLKLLSLALSLIPLILMSANLTHLLGEEVNHSWIPAMSIRFFLRVDSLSLVFLFLTGLIIPYSILASKTSSLRSPNVFFALILFLQAFLIGFFTSRDLALFTIFWEAMLIPLYLMILLWGGDRRQVAALKFIIYMIAGSVLMVAAVLFLYVSSIPGVGEGTFDLDHLMKISSGIPYAPFVFGAFMLAFAVKTPLFPFHAWLPDAYVEASLPGTILLSAILSKAGIYGILRIGYELFPDLLVLSSPLFLGLAIIGVLYAALLAWREENIKRLIAYSSLSHVNFVLVGVFCLNAIGQTGAIFQAFNHGITIAALFLVTGWLETRTESRSLHFAGGLCKYLPKLCWLTLFFVVAAVALPGTNNFVGELMVLFGLFGISPWLAALLGLSIILSVMYMLRLMQTVYFGPPSSFQKSWIDIGAKEIVIALPLIILILWLGIYPTPLLNLIKPTAAPHSNQELVK